MPLFDSLGEDAVQSRWRIDPRRGMLENSVWLDRLFPLSEKLTSQVITPKVDKSGNLRPGLLTRRATPAPALSCLKASERGWRLREARTLQAWHFLLIFGAHWPNPKMVLPFPARSRQTGSRTVWWQGCTEFFFCRNGADSPRRRKQVGTRCNRECVCVSPACCSNALSRTHPHFS